LYTPCILDCALRFSNKNFYLLFKKKKNSVCVSKAKILKPVLSLAHSNALFCGGWFIIKEH
jgi:hypothetical protein